MKYMLFCGGMSPRGGMDDFEGWYESVEKAVDMAEALGSLWYQVVNATSMVVEKRYFKY